MKRIITILKGLWIGSTMTVPGVSGGTMAILTNIYDELIRSVNGVFREPKRYVPFLLCFLIGAGTGFIALARFVTALLENPRLGVPTQFFFCGIVAGGIPFFLTKMDKKKRTWKQPVFFMVGLAIVISLIFVPKGTFMDSSAGIGVILQFFGGILVAAALVLPGISVTHMLFILGMYEPVMQAVSSFDLLSILPLVLGVVTGTFLTAGLVERLMKSKPEIIYITILGFVVGSIWQLFPKERIENPIVCVCVMFVGFCSIYYSTRKLSGKKQDSY